MKKQSKRNQDKISLILDRSQYLKAKCKSSISIQEIMDYIKIGRP